MVKRVYVGMSGGVDSSVTAALLIKKGYQVTGVFMKNWSLDLPGFNCPWKEDYMDAKRVAVQLGIPFKMYDFEKQYRQKVVNYLVQGYQLGITPNPDIICNQEIKFKLFLETALSDGADFIATGHYARIKQKEHQAFLYRGIDDNKDQSYFLYRIKEQALKKCLMPIGDYTKPQVRQIAKNNQLITAYKKDSQGICFIGKVGIKQFLLTELGPQDSGNIFNEAGHIVGRHDGAIFYTIGQRHGLNVGGGLPYYVIGKDMKKNEVYVTTNLQNELLWKKTLNLTKLHWINNTPEKGSSLTVRTRHRAELVSCRLEQFSDHLLVLKLNEEIRAVTPGQSAVIYEDQKCLGGGIII